jgi:polysaccharide chain length determinant protein (PEP-CTERM system associated)
LLAGGPAKGKTELPPVATPEIDARIDVQKRNLDALLQRYTEQHPDVVGTRRLLNDLEEQKRKEVAELQKRAAAEAAARPTTAGTANESLAAQELNRMLASSEVQVATVQARVEEYSARYAQLRESLKTAPQIEAEAAQLNRDYAVTKKAYEDLVSRRQSAVMSGDLDVASGVADFRLIDPPRVAPKPVSPNRLLLLPLVLLGAIVLGAFFAFAASQMRPTFASGEDLRKATGLPLLGVVTILTTDEDRRRDRVSLFRFVAASGGLVGLFAAGLITMTLVPRFGG